MNGQLDQSPGPETRSAAATRRPHPTVLLAEDDLQMRRLLTDSLLREGYRVVPCENGWELLSHLGSFMLDGEEHEEVDVVVTDIRMPGVTGLEILEGAVDSPVFPPVILITAFGDADTHADALRLGAWTILDKPFDMEDLVQELHVIAPLDRIGAPTE